jgi:cyclopropane-fatty-acyl-phospholipid synthase
VTAVGRAWRPWGLDRRLRAGDLEIVLPNGRSLRLSGRASGPTALLRLNRWCALPRFISGGTVGFGESYMDGDWDSPDLPKVIELVARNLPRKPMRFRNLSPWRIADRLGHRFRPNTRDGSKQNIAAHYDLGNDFYALWLDPSMTYSSAVFAGGNSDLQEAQAEKNRRLMDLASIGEGDRVLEIGCGWGGFAIQAARERGAHVTAVTVSQAQFNEAQKRVAAAGLGEKVDLQLRDYRDLDGTWDHAVSVEMIEAVGEKFWPEYFSRVGSAVRPGGTFALQAIVIENDRFDAYRRSADFIQKHIFPGGALPSPDVIRAHAQSAGMSWKTANGYGIDYADTLAQWRARFEAAGDRVTAMGFDERFRRCWSFYLAYCEGGFRAGNIDALQVALVKD